jgi:diaminopimelate epimerase
MNDLPFTKMQGAGNDFIIIDNRKQRLNKEKIIAITPQLCDRRFGIGADGIIALLPADSPSLDYTMFYRNADGSDAGMCGNGARCLALYAARLGLGREMSFNVHEVVYKASVNSTRNSVRLKFPMQLQISEINLPDEPPLFRADAGTQHIVQKVSRLDFARDDALRKRGEYLRYYEKFQPEGTNVNFICGQAPDKIRMKTYERGVEDLTLACGTGAIASAAVWHHMNHQSEGESEGDYTVKVKAEGGLLDVHFTYNNQKEFYSDIQLAGEAQFVFEGTFLQPKPSRFWKP